ncbi:hypothetical protein IGI04_026504 [Brassica rapa subsp. trilocularis]|uniref:Uncharacterized protein n=1 Tax=Brassica rapa subsp. trilocularis TaxID=1813537 RepID=A0ABQ7KWI9_BRACM|nr:hypothetical protein IGI04_026504 [Brassica rapa subsp. trilocularis]
MGDSEDETGYPKKFYPLNRLNHPMYTRPIPKFQAYYREEDDEQEDDKIKEDKGEGYNHRGKERLQKMLKPNKSVYGYEFVGQDMRTRKTMTRSLCCWKSEQRALFRESETQCRRMIDSLKRKYRKNKIKVDIHRSCSSKWLFFNKMDMLFTLRLSWSWVGLLC